MKAKPSLSAVPEPCAPTREYLDRLSEEIERGRISMKQFTKALQIALSGDWKKGDAEEEELRKMFQRDQLGSPYDGALYAVYLVLPKDPNMDKAGFATYVQKKRALWCDEFINDLIAQGNPEGAYNRLRDEIYKDPIMKVDLGLVHTMLQDDGTVNAIQHEDIDVPRSDTMRTTTKDVRLMPHGDVIGGNELVDCMQSYNDGHHRPETTFFIPRP